MEKEGGFSFRLMSFEKTTNCDRIAPSSVRSWTISSLVLCFDNLLLLICNLGDLGDLGDSGASGLEERDPFPLLLNVPRGESGLVRAPPSEAGSAAGSGEG